MRRKGNTKSARARATMRGRTGSERAFFHGLLAVESHLVRHVARGWAEPASSHVPQTFGGEELKVLVSRRVCGRPVAGRSVRAAAQGPPARCVSCLGEQARRVAGQGSRKEEHRRQQERKRQRENSYRERSSATSKGISPWQRHQQRHESLAEDTRAIRVHGPVRQQHTKERRLSCSNTLPFFECTAPDPADFHAP